MHDINWLHFAFLAVIALYLLVPSILIGLVLVRLLRIWRYWRLLGAGLHHPWDDLDAYRPIMNRSDSEISQLFSQSQEHLELFELPGSHQDGL